MWERSFHLGSNLCIQIMYKRWGKNSCVRVFNKSDQSNTCTTETLLETILPTIVRRLWQQINMLVSILYFSWYIFIYIDLWHIIRNITFQKKKDKIWTFLIIPLSLDAVSVIPGLVKCWVFFYKNNLKILIN